MNLWPVFRPPSASKDLFAPLGACVALERVGDAVLTCQCGRAWITQDGVFADTVLLAGQSIRLQRHGKTLVTGVSDARLSLAAPLWRPQ